MSYLIINLGKNRITYLDSLLMSCSSVYFVGLLLPGQVMTSSKTSQNILSLEVS